MVSQCASFCPTLALTTNTDDTLPSFGSRSDLEMLFANAQQQSQEAYPDTLTTSYNKIPEMNDAGRRPPTEGSASRMLLVSFKLLDSH